MERHRQPCLTRCAVRVRRCPSAVSSRRGQQRGSELAASASCTTTATERSLPLVALDWHPHNFDVDRGDCRPDCRIRRSLSEVLARPLSHGRSTSPTTNLRCDEHRQRSRWNLLRCVPAGTGRESRRWHPQPRRLIQHQAARRCWTHWARTMSTRPASCSAGRRGPARVLGRAS